MTPSTSHFARLGLLALCSLALVACDDNGAAAGGPQQPPPTVMTTTVERTTVEVERDYAGRVRGARTVEVRARVDGILEQRRFTEGQRVELGDVLFDIDARPFEIALRRAKAEQQNAQANVNQADREWQRIDRLFKQNTVSERDRDQILSQRELATAQLAMAAANVADAERNLSYAEVKAPLNGITGLEVLPEGSLVERGTLLTTITQEDPIHVRFSLPENDAALLRRQGAPSQRNATLIFPSGEHYDHAGVMDFTDSSIDPRTGSVMARAVFENPEGAVVPGQFVRARILLTTLEDIAMIPESAVGQGPEGPQVFVVEDNTAHARPVTLGPVLSQGQVVTDGLQDGDAVVINGQVMLRDGMPVNVANAENGGQ